MRLGYFGFSLWVAVSLPHLAIALDHDMPDPKQSALQQRVQQESIQANTSQIAAEIAEINQELKDSGASDLEIKDINNLLISLGTVTKDDMGHVIVSLQQAADSRDPKKSDGSLTTAYQAQQKVLAKITLIAARLQQKQTYARIAAELQDLLQRQISNLRLSAVVQKIGVIKIDRNYTLRGNAISTQEGLEPRLDALKAMVELLITKLPPDEGAALKADIDKTGLPNLSVAADAATTAAYGSAIDGSGGGWGGGWAQALKSEAEIRDTLTALLVVITAKDPDTALQEASDTLDRMIDDQQNLMDETKANANPAAKLPPDVDAKAKEDFGNRQDALNDSAAVLTSTLHLIDPGSLPALTSAANSMGDSSKALTAQDDPGSITAQGKALDALKQAKEKLNEQIAAAANEEPNDKNSQEEQLDAAAAALSAAANSTQSGEDDLAQNSAQGNADAASPISDASGNLDKADATGALPGDAKAAVAEARAALQAAKDSAGKGQSKDGQGHAQEAAAEIAKAQSAVEKAAAAFAETASHNSTVGAGGMADTSLQTSNPGIGTGDLRGGIKSGFVHGDWGRNGEVTELHILSREAITQLPNETVPVEFGGMVGQYYKNLANSAGTP